MKKIYPIIVQIEHLDDSRNIDSSIFSIQSVLDQEFSINKYLNQLKNVELEPSNHLIKQILTKGLYEN